MPSVNRSTRREDLPDNLGEQLKRHRLALGWSVSRLAEVAGVSRRTVQRIEAGGCPHAHTVSLLQEALQLDDESLVPAWELPDAASYGSRARARRLWLGLSLEEVGARLGVSASKLSRFERGVSTPHKWFAEWVDREGRMRDAIIARSLAQALEFRDVRALHDFCMATSVGDWASPTPCSPDLGPIDTDALDVPDSRAFPTMEELRVARYRAGNATSEPEPKLSRPVL